MMPLVLLNAWQVKFFSMDHDIVMSIAKSAGKAGIEMIVLDDGWFGKRSNVSSSPGD